MGKKVGLILFILLFTVMFKVYSAVDVDFTGTYVTRCIWRGQDLFGNNDGAFQPSINFSKKGLLEKTSLDFNIWAAFPLSSGHEDAQEIDYTISLTHDLFEDRITLSEGYTYFDYPNTNSISDMQEPWISLSLNELANTGICLNLFAGYDFPAESGGPEDGWYYAWGLSKDFSLPTSLQIQPEQILSLGITNWATDGATGLPSSSLYATEISLETSFNLQKLTVNPSLNYVINHNDSINQGKEEFWAGIEINYSY